MIKGLQKAVNFANKVHDGQVRKDVPIPYIVHPLSVVRLLAQCEIDNPDILIAAALHDVIEDTNTTADDLLDMFSETAVNYVVELTMPDDIIGSAAKTEYLEDFSLSASQGAVIIKAADRICNVEDYHYSGKLGYAQKYALQAVTVFGRALTFSEELKNRIYEMGILTNILDSFRENK